MQKDKYSNSTLHPIRYMESHIEEVISGNVEPDRTQELKTQFATVKELAFEMYKDAYTFIMKLNGEMMQDPEGVWKQDLQAKKSFSSGINRAFGNYSDENLHPIRHLDEYIQKMEKGPSIKEIEKLGNRFGRVLRLSVELYYDAERLIRMLDE